MSFLSYFFIYTTLFLFLEGFLLIFLWCKSGSNGLFFFSIKFTFLDLYYSSIYFIEMHFCFVYTVLWGVFFCYCYILYMLMNWVGYFLRKDIWSLFFSVCMHFHWTSLYSVQHCIKRITFWYIFIHNFRFTLIRPIASSDLCFSSYLEKLIWLCFIKQFWPSLIFISFGF